ncbi:hypothetical protein JCGZ_17250 [Jatropha curcas]|uniref:Uncharacterized protein n=1 Tax=Jatropha curcas TaxID=180498 RepID=A0A067LEI0_JATCU|nr:GDSL esterase/lipase At2g30310 [Jatropha curcas]KDP45643.1 hypothetical protein JCGZ_17250 [Jatropha curcas]
MAEIKFIILWTIFCFLDCCNGSCEATNSSSLPKFSALLFFGDSLLDTGNNNYIKTVLNANYAPYGQDYPGNVPTGRFSNGKLIPDMLGSILASKEAVPPYLDPKVSDSDIVSGVNFASAGSGYDDSTALLTNVIPFSRQIELFKEYIERLKGIIGEVKAKEIINGSLVFISSGTNDLILNYYDIPTRRLEFTVSDYQDFLLDRLQKFVKEFYDLGCRSIVVCGIVPIGSLPLQMVIGRLVSPFSFEDQNRDIQLYNQKLTNLLPQLQATLPGTKFVYYDIYETALDLVNHPEKYGFTETKKACCGNRPGNLLILCDPLTPPCEDASKFLFWDTIHPTLTGYQFLFKDIVENVLPQFL